MKWPVSRNPTMLMITKNSLLIGLNIRITEVYVKQKGGIETESLGWENQESAFSVRMTLEAARGEGPLYSGDLRIKICILTVKMLENFLILIGDANFERPESPFLPPFNTP